MAEVRINLGDNDFISFSIDKPEEFLESMKNSLSNDKTTTISNDEKTIILNNMNIKSVDVQTKDD